METYITQFKTLNTAIQNGKPAPHKAILLLSVIDLIDRGELESNHILLSDALRDRFKQNWRTYINDGRESNNSLIRNPFKYMNSEPFWESLESANEATIDKRLYELLLSDANRNRAKEVLRERYINYYLDNCSDINMDEILEIADKIENHVLLESKENVPNRAIGGGKVVLKGNDLHIWIVNREIRRTATIQRDITGQIRGTEIGEIKDVIKSDGTVTSKNTYWGRMLLENYEGEHEYLDRTKKKIVYRLCNSFTYEMRNTNVSNLRLGCKELGGFMIFKLLKDLRNKFSQVKETADKEKLAKQKVEELRLKEEREKEEYEKALLKANNEKEAKLIEERRKQEELKRQQEIEEENKRILELEKERIEMERALQNGYERYINAVSFIREQACLRNNPILDKRQNDIKFSHLFDNTTVIIDGGPGTGKTTTLIQRLKFLISRHDLEDYIMNTGEFNLNNAQLELLTDERSNWIFFSPTDSLCKYLRSNMEYEGLINPGDKTKVWHNYLQGILRDYYQLAGPDLPFEFKRKNLTGKSLYKDESLKIQQRFFDFYFSSLKSRVWDNNEVDLSKFSWQILGKIVNSIRAKAKDVKSIDEFIRLLFELERIKDLSLPEGNFSVMSLINESNEQLKKLSVNLMVQINREPGLSDEISKMILSWDTVEENEDEILNDIDDEISEEENTNKIEIKLNQAIKGLLKSLSLKTIDSKVKIQGRKLALYEKVSHLIDVEDLNKLAEKLYFGQYIYPPFLRNPESILFSSVSQLYKRFRRDMLKLGAKEWNIDTLDIIVNKYKNKVIHQQEQSLLLGFINNLILSIRKISKVKFDKSKNKYVTAYKACCRPIIGVDEATDYSVYDYYAISSLRHYLISSVTLTGDIMQCLNEDGISRWDVLKKTDIFKKTAVEELNVSYRQSPELIKLADHIYRKVMSKESPYKCSLGNDDMIPKPLWFFHEDEDDKIEWIISRILEVKRAYNLVPSIAVFAANKEAAAEINEIMNDSERLDAAGIQVVDCSNGLTEAGTDMIRIYPIEMVKGMEFEVAFFHDLHKIKALDLLDKYLYVGLSRASFYMGVTSSLEINDSINDIVDLFETEGNWSL